MLCYSGKILTLTENTKGEICGIFLLIGIKFESLLNILQGIRSKIKPEILSFVGREKTAA